MHLPRDFLVSNHSRVRRKDDDYVNSLGSRNASCTVGTMHQHSFYSNEHKFWQWLFTETGTFFRMMHTCTTSAFSRCLWICVDEGAILRHRRSIERPQKDMTSTAMINHLSFPSRWRMEREKYCRYIFSHFNVFVRGIDEWKHSHLYRLGETHSRYKRYFWFTHSQSSVVPWPAETIEWRPTAIEDRTECGSAIILFIYFVFNAPLISDQLISPPSFSRQSVCTCANSLLISHIEESV